MISADCILFNSLNEFSFNFTFISLFNSVAVKSIDISSTSESRVRASFGIKKFVDTIRMK